MAKAMFGAGCFWGVEYNFNKVEGVNEAVSGYSGGKVDNPTYEQVCTNTTDHAEVVLLTMIRMLSLTINYCRSSGKSMILRL